jgi:hypothetical protein
LANLLILKKEHIWNTKLEHLVKLNLQKGSLFVQKGKRMKDNPPNPRSSTNGEGEVQR